MASYVHTKHLSKGTNHAVSFLLTPRSPVLPNRALLMAFGDQRSSRTTSSWCTTTTMSGRCTIASRGGFRCQVSAWLQHCDTATDTSLLPLVTVTSLPFRKACLPVPPIPGLLVLCLLSVSGNNLKVYRTLQMFSVAKRNIGAIHPIFSGESRVLGYRVSCSRK